jgi:hypothetical protein
MPSRDPYFDRFRRNTGSQSPFCLTLLYQSTTGEIRHTIVIDAIGDVSLVAIRHFIFLQCFVYFLMGMLFAVFMSFLS